MSQGPENREGVSNLNWESYFSSEPLPPRQAIDPERKLQGEELADKVEKYLKQQGKKLNTGQPIWITEEYVDLLEEQIRPVAEAVNQLEYAKTYASCQGHPINREEYQKKPVVREDGVTEFPDLPTHITPDGRFEYDEPYLMLLVDTQNPKTAELYQALQETARELTNQFGNLHIRGTRTPVDPRVSKFKIDIEVGVSDSWIRENNKQSLHNMQKKTMGTPDSKPADPSDPYKYERERQYLLEYGDYFESEDARKIIQSTFQAIAQTVQTKLITKKSSPA